MENKKRMTTQTSGWVSAFKAFLDRRALIMLFLGFSAGIPINRAVDQPRQIYLCELALDFAQKVLGPNGQFVVKVFQGAGFDEFRKQVVDSFDVLKTAKPAASRARSKEVFLVGQGRKKALQ